MLAGRSHCIGQLHVRVHFCREPWCSVGRGDRGVQWVHDCGICWRYLMISYHHDCNDMQWYAMICNHMQSYHQGVSRRQRIECHPLITVQVVLMLWNRDSLRMLRRRILWRRCLRPHYVNDWRVWRNLVCSDLAAHFRYQRIQFGFHLCGCHIQPS